MSEVKASWKPSRSGGMVVAGLICFGLIILGGLYITPKAHAPSAPPNVPAGAPNKTLRFVCYDLSRQRPRNDPMFAEIIRMQPAADYVLLQGVEEDHVAEIAEALEMQRWFHPQLYQRSELLAGKKGTWGNLLLSRDAIYQGEPMGGKRGGFGISALAVVEDRAFTVACLHLAAGDQGVAEAAEFSQDWKSQSSRPMVAAVLPTDPAPPPAMAFLPQQKESRGQWFYLTGEWSILNSGIVQGAGNGRAPMWIDVKRNNATTEQNASTQKTPS